MPDQDTGTAQSSITLQMLEALAYLSERVTLGQEPPTGHELATHQGRAHETNALKTMRKLSERGLWTRTPFAITPAGYRLLNDTIEMIDEARPVITHGALMPSPLNPRTRFDETALIELAKSIQRHGLIQPIVARPKAGRPGLFEIVAGERRWQAIGLLILEHTAPNWTAETPLKVEVQPMSDCEVLETALAENGDRLDPHPLDEARGFARLVDLNVAQGMKRSAALEHIARRMAKTKRFVEIRVKIARDLNAEAHEALASDAINFTQAMELSRAKPETQTTLLSPIIRGEDGYRTQSQIIARIREIEAARPLPLETSAAQEPSAIADEASPGAEAAASPSLEAVRHAAASLVFWTRLIGSDDLDAALIGDRLRGKYAALKTQSDCAAVIAAGVEAGMLIKSACGSIDTFQRLGAALSSPAMPAKETDAPPATDLPPSAAAAEAAPLASSQQDERASGAVSSPSNDQLLALIAQAVEQGHITIKIQRSETAPGKALVEPLDLLQRIEALGHEFSGQMGLNRRFSTIKVGGPLITLSGAY